MGFLEGAHPIAAELLCQLSSQRLEDNWHSGLLSSTACVVKVPDSGIGSVPFGIHTHAPWAALSLARSLVGGGGRLLCKGRAIVLQ